MWVSIEDDIVTIGITDYSQEQMGEILEIELPRVGNNIERDEAFGSVETARGIAELVSPVTGEVIAVNEDLLDDIGILNSDPHETGWIIMVELKDPGEMEELLTSDEYNEFLAEEISIV